jgi:hypothetical protein
LEKKKYWLDNKGALTMIENNPEYRTEVPPVVNEKKSLELTKQTNDLIAFSFEATSEEIAEFLSQTYKSGIDRVEEMWRKSKPCKKYQISLIGQSLYGRIFDRYGFSGIHYDVGASGISETGEILDKYYSSVFLDIEADIFHYFGLEYYEEIEKIHPFVSDALYGDKKGQAT